MAEREIKILAYAKINVFLRVLGRRDDGYHDIESLIFPISLADLLRFHVRPTGATEGRSQSDLSVERIRPNLVWVAAERLAEHCGDLFGLRYLIVKSIPVAAGLGGGSADAAATLVALNDLWRCGMSREELARVGADIGSDVPALLKGGPVVMRGRGDVIQPLEAGRSWWVLVPQGFPVSTPDAYRWWDQEGQTGPNPEAILSAIADGRFDDAATLLFNDLEPVVAGRHPEVGTAKRALLEAGALGAVMSGSGPTVAGLARDEGHARDIAATVPRAIAVSAPP